MKNALFWKAAALFVLVLVLMIPLSMVHATIGERAQYQQEARADIARSWGGEQQVVGPFLLQTYEIPVKTEVWDKHREIYVEKTDWQIRRQLSWPGKLQIDGDAQVEKRYRGIYAVPVYRADIRMDATLVVPVPPDGANNVVNEVLVAISDTRGFRQQPLVSWNGNALTVKPGTGTAVGNGVHAPVAAAEGTTHDVSVELALGGSRRFSVAPLGGDTQMTLNSTWPHPSFTGGYLPTSYEIDASGFRAAWQTSHYATTVRDSLSDCIHQGNCEFSETQLIALELAEPVNVYLLNERSTKYGLLFVLVVFGVFLVYELLRRLRIHPVQYGLVGLAQAIFFLLLLSLSEHMAFGLAYLAGAGACVSLLAFYVSHVLGGWSRGLGFGALLATIYAALYVILQSEDHALLLGSVLLFGLLAIAMYLTRRIDWYAVEVPGRGGEQMVHQS